MTAAEHLREQFADVPASMLAARRWLVWMSIPQPGKKPRKVPVYANGRQRNGLLDSDADLAQLTGFDEACAALASGKYAGLGFALGPDGTGNAWQGVDLDDLAARPELSLLADDLPGYTETSPSGNGLHAIGYGREFAALGSNGTGIEAYSAGRYFTVTGEGAGLGEPTDIADFVVRVLAPRHGVRPAPVSAEVSEFIDQRTIAELRSALAAMRADDRDLWVANGQRLKKLGEPGRALWLEWSQQSDKFDPADASRVWDSFTADRTGYQAIFAEAQRRGWLNPLSGSAALPRATEPEATTPILRLARFTTADIEAAKKPQPNAFMGGWKGQVGLFPVGEVTVIGAPGREGKTSVMMAIAQHYAIGKPLAGLAPEEIKSVLIYSAEDDRDQYARKTGALLSKMVPDEADLFLQNLYVPDLHCAEVAHWREIVTVPDRKPVRGRAVGALIDSIMPTLSQPMPLGLLIFETASTLSDAEEDNAGHKVMVAALKHIAKTTNTAVVLMHHTSQNAATQLPDLNISEADIRGGTTLVNNSRQCFLLVNLGSDKDPLPEGDARTLLRSLVAPTITERVTALICLNSSKGMDPPPIFFRWDITDDFGPRLVEVTPPERVAGKSWKAVKAMLAGVRAEAKADKKAEAGNAHMRLVVEAAFTLAAQGEQPTAAKISAKCARSPTWAKPYLAMAVELGELSRSTEQVPRTRGFTDVYRPSADAPKPWEEGDSTRDSTASNNAPWSQK